MKKYLLAFVIVLLALASVEVICQPGNGLAKPLVISPFPATARTLKGSITTTTTSPNQLANEGIAEATLLDDPGFQDCYRTVKSIRAYVHFHAGGADEIYELGKQTWSSTVRGNVYGVDQYNAEHQLTTADVELSIDQTHPEAVFILPSTLLAPNEHPYHSSPATLYYKKLIFKINAASGGVNGFDPSTVADANAKLVLSMCVNDEIVYEFPSSPAFNELLSCDVEGRAQLGSISCSPENANRASQVVNATDVVLTWNLPVTCSDAKYALYEVEFLRLYNVDPAKSLTPYEISAVVDWNAAIRYTVRDKRELQVVPIHGSGYYVWRVRPITTLYDGQANNPRNCGPWSEAPAQGASVALAPCSNDYSRTLAQTVLSDPYPHVACFYFQDADNTRSYLHNVTIANDTSRSSIIVDSRGYVDALGRIVQSQVLDRSSELVLGGQTVFDRNGRASLSSMSGPLSLGGTPVAYQSTIKFNTKALQTSANALFTADSYDDIATTYTSPTATGTATGIGTYYSDANSDLTVPGSGGYPYARTLYNSEGRRRATISPGSAFRGVTPQDSRTARTLTSNVSMVEMLSIFGSESPNPENVTKVLTISPDGVWSGSYVNTEGQLLATFIVGGTELDGNTTTPDGKLRITANGDAALLNLNGSLGTSSTDQLELVNSLSIEHRIESGVRVHPDTIIGSTRFTLAGTTTVTFSVIWRPIKIQFGTVPNDKFCLDACKECKKTIRLRVLRVDVVPATIVLDEIVTPPDPSTSCFPAAVTRPYISTDLPAGEYVVEKIETSDSKSSTTGLTGEDETVVSIVTESTAKSTLQTLMNTLFSTSTDPIAQLDQYKTYLSTHGSSPHTVTTTLGASAACVTVPLPDAKDCNDCSKFDFEGYVKQRYMDAFNVPLYSDGELGRDHFYYYIDATGNALPKYSGSHSEENFGTMVTAMIASECGYDCKKLWYIWKALADSRIDMLKANSKAQVGTVFGGDIVEQFLDLAGRKCYATTDVVKEGMTISDADAADAYKYIRTAANTTEIANCIAQNTVGSDVNWDAVNICLNTRLTDNQRDDLEGATDSPIPTGIDDPITSKITDMNSTAQESFLNTCKDKCEAMRPLIEEQVRAMYTTPADGFVYCQVQAIIDDCKANCVMPSSTDTPTEQLARANRLKAQLFGKLTVAFPYEGCPTGHTQITNVKPILDLLIEYLNHDYQVRQENATEIGCVNYAVVIYKFLNSFGNVTIPQCVLDEAFADNVLLPEAGTSTDCSYGETDPPTNGYRFRLRVIPHVKGEFYRPGNADNSCLLCGLAFRGPRTAPYAPHPWVGLLNSMMNSLWGVHLSGSPTPVAGTQFLSAPGHQPTYETILKYPAVLMSGGTNADTAVIDSTYDYINRLYDYSAFVNGSLFRSYAFSYGNLGFLGPFDTPVAVFYAFDNNSYRLADSTSSKDGLWRSFGSYGIQFQHLTLERIPIAYSFFGWSLDPTLRDTAITSLTLHTVANGRSLQYEYPTTDSATEYTSIADSLFTQRIGAFEQDAQARLAYRDKVTNELFPIDEVKFYGMHVRYLLGVVGDQDCAITNLCEQVTGCAVCVKWDTIDVTNGNAPDKIGPIKCELEELERLKLEISRAYYLEVEKLKAFVRSAYDNVCRNPNLVRDPVTITYNEKYYHYTLYYYDRAGRLVRTVSPKGVDIDPTRSISTTPSHTFVSRFKTNSIGQVQIKLVPDGGKEEYFYDAKGRLRFVADAVQSSATPKRMSYVRYDRLGRTVETGEVVLPSSGTNASISAAAAAEADDASFPDNSLQRNDVVQYYYDVKATTLPTVVSNWTVVHTEQPDFVQKNVRGRLSLALSVPTLAAGYDVDATSTDVVRSFFAYDAQGSLTNYVVDIPVDNTATADRLIKQTAYQYDAGTGAVTQVDYQPKSEEDRHDRLIRRYHYDAMGRMDTVRTSPDGVLFDTDARYSYYKHGPLKREVIGEDMVQGRDYVYTLLGQIKGINHPTLDPTKDPGGDDGTGHVAKDAFAMSFGYYTGDFDRHYGSVNSPFNAGSPGIMAPPVSLYSGLVGSWVQNTALMTVPSGQTLLRNNEQMGESFRYDILGRLRTTTTATYNGTTWVQENADGYSSLYSYDQNSNLRRIRRHTKTSATSGAWLDDAVFAMLSASSDAVEVVDEAVAGLSDYPIDLKLSTSPINHVDGKGRADISGPDDATQTAEYNSFNQPVDEKLRDQTNVTYLHDPFGRTIRQNESSETGSLNRFWILDPNGAELASYVEVESGIELRDKYIYGLGRIGSSRDAHESPSSTTFDRTIGSKLYELTDHLGSIRGLVSDVKTPQTTGFESELLSTADYESYGLARPYRSTSSLDIQYDFGFQGMRKATAKYQINEYVTEFRRYDAATGRWNSLDPISKASNSGYEGLGSAPNLLVDPLGLQTESNSIAPNPRSNNGSDVNLVKSTLPSLTPGLPMNGSMGGEEKSAQSLSSVQLPSEKKRELEEAYKGRFKVMPSRIKLTGNDVVDAVLWSVWDLYTTPENLNLIDPAFETDRVYRDELFEGPVDDEGYVDLNNLEYIGPLKHGEPDPAGQKIQKAGPMNKLIRRLSKLAKNGKLIQHLDNQGAHIKDFHVGKSVRWLKQRLIDEGKTIVSSFLSNAGANFGMFRAIEENKAAIQQMVADPLIREGTQMTLPAVDVQLKIGVVVTRNSVELSSKVALVVKKCANCSNGFSVVTVKIFK